VPRMLDFDCHSCGHTIRDKFFMEVPDVYPCPQCGAAMDRAWYLLRRERAQWSEADSVLVFRDTSGKIRYPCRNDAPTPSGCERVLLRSLREVDRFEREHHVVNERMHFDNNGRGLDDKYRGEDYSH
jgi:hypothetical protein